MARKCSYLIWINRFNKDFEPWRIHVSPSLNPLYRRKRGRTADERIAVRRTQGNKTAALKILEKKMLLRRMQKHVDKRKEFAEAKQSHATRHEVQMLGDAFMSLSRML